MSGSRRRDELRPFNVKKCYWLENMNYSCEHGHEKKSQKQNMMKKCEF